MTVRPHSTGGPVVVMRPALPGFALCVWSNLMSCWCVIALSEQRERVASLAERMTLCADLFSSHFIKIVPVPSTSDDDVEAKVLTLHPPRYGRPFVAHAMDDPNR